MNLVDTKSSLSYERNRFEISADFWVLSSLSKWLTMKPFYFYFISCHNWVTICFEMKILVINMREFSICSLKLCVASAANTVTSYFLQKVQYLTRKVTDLSCLIYAGPSRGPLDGSKFEFWRYETPFDDFSNPREVAWMRYLSEWWRSKFQQNLFCVRLFDDESQINIFFSKTYFFVISIIARVFRFHINFLCV